MASDEKKWIVSITWRDPGGDITNPRTFERSPRLLVDSDESKTCKAPEIHVRHFEAGTVFNHSLDPDNNLFQVMVELFYADRTSRAGILLDKPSALALRDQIDEFLDPGGVDRQVDELRAQYKQKEK